MLLMTSERLLYVDCVRYVWSRAICGLSVGYVLYIYITPRCSPYNTYIGS
jgi:hypothetical protein